MALVISGFSAFRIDLTVLAHSSSVPFRGYSLPARIWQPNSVPGATGEYGAVTMHNKIERSVILWAD